MTFMSNGKKISFTFPLIPIKSTNDYIPHTQEEILQLNKKNAK